jgi:hypothetical protein
MTAVSGCLLIWKISPYPSQHPDTIRARVTLPVDISFQSLVAVLGRVSERNTRPCCPAEANPIGWPLIHQAMEAPDELVKPLSCGDTYKRRPRGPAVVRRDRTREPRLAVDTHGEAERDFVAVEKDMKRNGCVQAAVDDDVFR